MFILNKNTKIIQECHNKDVIKVCRKDTKNYAVAATREELTAGASDLAKNQPEMSQGEGMANEGQKTDPEGTQGAQGSNPEEQQTNGGQDPDPVAGQDDWKNLPEEEKLAALEAKKVDELRKIAKAEGIQGYGNMNKDTLVAMIMNH